MRLGDRVYITDRTHSWSGHAGEICAPFRSVAVPVGWLVRLDSGQETYVQESQMKLEPT